MENSIITVNNTSYNIEEKWLELAKKFWKKVVKMTILNVIRLKENLIATFLLKTRPMSNL